MERNIFVRTEHLATFTLFSPPIKPSPCTIKNKSSFGVNPNLCVASFTQQYLHRIQLNKKISHRYRQFHLYAGEILNISLEIFFVSRLYVDNCVSRKVFSFRTLNRISWDGYIYYVEYRYNVLVFIFGVVPRIGVEKTYGNFLIKILLSILRLYLPRKQMITTY